MLNREAPLEYLSEWAALVGQESETVSRGQRSVQVFRLMSEWLALPAHYWVEVVTVRPIRHVPHRSNNILLGLVCVRGEIHLCVSLANLLGIEKGESAQDGDTQSGHRRFCMVKKDNFSWIFPADEVLGIVSYSDEDVGRIPSTVAGSFQKFTCGLLNVAGNKIGLLHESVFDVLSRSIL